MRERIRELCVCLAVYVFIVALFAIPFVVLGVIVRAIYAVCEFLFLWLF
jgi:hypothetical protein